MQKSRSETPVDIETPMSEEDKMEIEQNKDSPLPVHEKSKSPAKKPAKRTPGRPRKSQQQREDSSSTDPGERSERGSNDLSGLSLLSEAASLSLKELVETGRKPDTVHSPQDDNDSKEWDENRPRFLSEHAYYAMPSVEEDRESTATLSAEEDNEDDELKGHRQVWIDHNYCQVPPPNILAEWTKQIEKAKALQKEIEKQAAAQVKDIRNENIEIEKPKKKGRKRKNTLEALADITNKSDLKVSRELASLLEPVKPKEIVKFEPRTFEEERQVFYNIFSNGIDIEDVNFLKQTYEHLLSTDDPMFYWLNDILWVDHPITNIPDPVPLRKRRKTDHHHDVPTSKHKTGVKLVLRFVLRIMFKYWSKFILLLYKKKIL